MVGAVMTGRLLRRNKGCTATGVVRPASNAVLAAPVLAREGGRVGWRWVAHGPSACCIAAW